MSKRRPFLSGHCSPGNPPEIHALCRGGHGPSDAFVPCSCPHHSEKKAAPVSKLIEYPDIDQGSDAWHDQRRGMVTASVVGQLITAKTFQPASNDTARSLAALLVAERITGYTEPTYLSDDMYRGLVDEPLALAKYDEHFAPVTKSGFMVREDEGVRIGYSPDALVGTDGLVEVKSRRQKIHLQTILSDEVPAANVAQLQCGLLVSGRAWIDYVSYCGGMPMWVKRVEPDPRWFEAITRAVKAFETAALLMLAAYDAATDGLPATERIDNSMEIV